MGNAKVQSRVLTLSLMLICCGVSKASAALPEIIGVVRSDTTYTLFGYSIVPLGDQNGDGFSDFLVWDYRFSAYLYHGGNPPDTQPYLRINSVSGPVAIGDINHDQIDDFGVLGRFYGSRKLSIFLGGPGGDTLRDAWFGWDSLAAITPAVSYWDSVCGGLERLFAQGYNQQTILVANPWSAADTVPSFVLRPTWFPYPGFVFAEAMAVGDFNGDGHPDFITNLRPDEQYQRKGEVCVYWGDCSHNSLPSVRFTQAGPWSSGRTQFGSVIRNVGDVNGDGYPDLFVGHGNSTDTVSYVFFGGPAFDSIPDLVLPDHTEHVTPGRDLNGDGIDDFLTSLAIQSSSYSYVNVYYGGSHLDSVPDLRINVSEMPEYLVLFGMDIAGLGDVNGDGINDFAVSGQDQFGHGVVYIFSGKKAPNDVLSSGDPTPPNGFALHQNYPNPFNATTLISFSVPKRAGVKVTVTDMLGRVRGTLVDRVLDAGTYKATWDAEKFASGTYICVLEAGDIKLTRKMVLVK